MTRLTVGTRGSKLALAQTDWVVQALRLGHPDLEITVQVIQTQGDLTQAANVPLASFGEKGIFAKELETALLTQTIDLAVHSMKDMVHTLPDGLTIAAVPLREDPRDCLVGMTLDALPLGARVGTGSVRRRALLWSRRPDLQCLEIRGNIDTRLRKLGEGQYDAICLAVAGLNRLSLQGEIAEILDPDWFTPDPGQGALALETRQSDEEMHHLVEALNHKASLSETIAERGFLRALGGGCKTPLGALAMVGGHDVYIAGMVAAPDGTTILRDRTNAHISDLNTVGAKLADKLRMAGADRLLADVS